MTASVVSRSRRRVTAGRVRRSAFVLLPAAFAGFLLVSHAGGGSPPRQTPLATASEQDLARILADLNAEADALQEEIGLLRLQLNELRRSSESAAAAAEARAGQLRTLQVLAGTVAVSGPGLVVRISDPERAISYDSMIDVVQELRDAGSEAIAINGRRVGATTAFSEEGGRITVDGAGIAPPYEIAAIGQPSTLEGGLKIPGGAIDALEALRDTVVVEAERRARIDLPALERPVTFEVARPVGSTP
jgi:uncharacterized protein YlxW (UPF0749 family)